jgi:hypothetical protein
MSTDELSKKLQSIDSHKIAELANSKWGWIPLLLLSFLAVAKLPPDQRDSGIEAVGHLVEVLGSNGPAVVYIVGSFFLVRFINSIFLKPYIKTREEYATTYKGIESKFEGFTKSCENLVKTINESNAKQHDTLISMQNGIFALMAQMTQHEKNVDTIINDYGPAVALIAEKFSKK